jgi:ABC-2 type transport system ATP-binding protein
MIQVSNLVKRFGSKTAVAGISFQVGKGEIVGLLGPNGAGKSTTLRILGGYFAATEGLVQIDGLDNYTHSIEVRERIGYMPEVIALYPEMRVFEYLEFRGRLKGLHGKKLRSRMDRVLADCSLVDVRRSIIGTLSKGYCQRVGLADALIHDPPVLILDEPTIGLDPHQIRQIRTLIRSLAPKHTVLLSSHILPEVEAMCSRILIIDKGRVVASGTQGSLLAMPSSAPRVIVEIWGEPTTIAKVLTAVPGVASVTADRRDEWTRFTCICADGADPRVDIFRAVASNGWVLKELTQDRVNLEDVFMAVTSAGSGTASAGGAAL